jgi:hypothetical protein
MARQPISFEECARGTYRVDVQHFLRILSIATPAELPG